MVVVGSLAVILCMLVLNAVLAAYEMALASITRTQARVLAQENRRGAKDTLFMKEQIEGSLAVIQLGITLVGVIAAAVGGANVDEALAPYLAQRWDLTPLASEILSLVIFVIPLSAVTIIFGELVPKTFALKHREWVCLRLSPTMRILYALFLPVVSLFEKVVKAVTELGSKKIGGAEGADLQGTRELKAVASLARASSLIGIREEKIVHSAAELSARPVREIVIPAAQISLIPLRATLTEALIQAHMDMHTRFPVCREENDPQSIVGYVNIKDIIYALHANPTDPSLKAIVRPMKIFDADTRLSAVMEVMIQESLHIGLVQEGGKQLLGMVTLEDILEEMVGEILDEYDRLPTYVHPYGDGWVMAGGVLLEKAAAITGVDISRLKRPEAPGVNTLSQWCRHVTHDKLKGAEAFESSGLIVTIRKFRRNQVLEVFVTRSAEKNAGAEG